MTDLVFDRTAREYVLAVVRRFVRCTQVAEDVTQDALLNAYRHRDKFRGEAQARTWLYRVAANAALGYLRTERRRHARIALESGTCEEVPDLAEPADAELCTRREARKARTLIDALPPRYRDVLLLRRDHTEQETADTLGLSLTNVKVIAHRARAKLREDLVAA